MALISLSDYAKRIGRHVSSVRAKVENGSLNATKIGNAWVIDEDEPYVKGPTLTEIGKELPNVRWLQYHFRTTEEVGAYDHNVETLECAIADFTDGEFTLAVYAYGDAKLERHYYMWESCVDVTDIIISWRGGEIDRRECCRRIKRRIENDATIPELLKDFCSKNGESVSDFNDGELKRKAMYVKYLVDIGEIDASPIQKSALKGYINRSK